MNLLNSVGLLPVLVPALLLISAIVLRCRVSTSVPCVICLPLCLALYAASVSSPSRQTSEREVESTSWVEFELPAPSAPAGPAASIAAPVSLSGSIRTNTFSVEELVGDLHDPGLSLDVLTAATAAFNLNTRVKAGTVNWDDYITQRLLKHGGKEGEVTFTLIWFDASDLDLWLYRNGGGLGYSNKKFWGGELDVDCNVEIIVPDPCENITFVNVLPPPASANDPYRVVVKLYKDRTTTHVSKFVLRVVMDGKRQLYLGDVSTAKPAVTMLTFD